MKESPRPGKPKPRQPLSHYNKSGQVAMVDVSAKETTTRTASAEGFVRMNPAVVRAVRRLKNPKGDPLEVARIAGIAACKRTAEWIPLCHPLPLTHIAVTARLCKNGVAVHSSVTATAQTGVEMEALVAVSAAALTVYDMCKALDKSMEITDIVLLEKTGGKSGEYRRDVGVRATRKNSTGADRIVKSLRRGR
jgi:cyclic pyranopterin monophosphate synthase